MSRLLSLALAALLAVLLVGTPASAAPRPPDPEVTRPAAHPAEPSAARVAPASVDSDVAVYASTPTGRVYFVLAGRLRLQLKAGSTTAYKGSLVDHTGQKSYKASADTTDVAAPVVKLEGKNGKFTFRSTLSFGTSSYTGVATSKPKKLKVPVDQVALSGVAHYTRTAAYSFVLTERAGAMNNPVEYTGSLTLAYDANGRISGGRVTVTDAKGKVVTNDLTSSGYVSTSYFYTVAKVDKKYFGLSATISPSGISGFGFAADGAKTSQWILTGSA